MSERNEGLPILKRKYSDKGGHLERGSFQKQKRQEASAFPGIFMRAVPASIEAGWFMRRNSRRISLSGRR